MEIGKIISFIPVCKPFSQILLLQYEKKGYKLGYMQLEKKVKPISLSKAMLSLKNVIIGTHHGGF